MKITKRSFGRVAAATTALLLAVGGVSTNAPQAQAAPTQVMALHTIDFSVYPTKDARFDTQIGNYETSVGFGYSGDPSAAPYQVRQSFGDPKRSSDTWRNQQGITVSANTLHAISALLTLYGDTKDPATAAAVDLALRSLLGYTNWSPKGSLPGFSWDLRDAKSPVSIAALAVKGLYATAFKMELDAIAAANDWNGTGIFTVTGDKFARAGSVISASVRLPGIDASTGHGWKVTFTVTKPDGTQESFTTTTVKDVASIAYKTAPGVAGTYTVSAALAGSVPQPWPLISKAGNCQTLFFTAGPARTWSSAQAGAVTVSAPAFTTKASAVTTAAGVTISDTVNLTGLFGQKAGPFQAPKADPKKADPKKATPTKADPKKAAPAKADPKKATPAKADPKSPAGVGNPRKPDQKVTPPAPKKADPKKAAPAKADPKKAAPAKVDPKKAAPAKVDPKKADPKKADPKKPAPRVDLKVGPRAGVWTGADSGFVLTGLLLSTAPLADGVSCPGVGDAAWKTATVLAALPPTAIKQIAINRDGTAQVFVTGYTVPAGTTTAMCTSFAQTLTWRDARTGKLVNVTEPAGVPDETILLAPASAAAAQAATDPAPAAAAPADTTVQTGGSVITSTSASIMGGGLAALVAAGLALLVARRRTQMA